MTINQGTAQTLLLYLVHRLFEFISTGQYNELNKSTITGIIGNVFCAEGFSLYVAFISLNPKR